MFARVRTPVGLGLVALVLASCAAAPAGSVSPSQASVSASPSSTPAESPSTFPTPSESEAPTVPPLIGGLQVEGFAEVVADRLQMRKAPGLDAEVVVEPLYGDYPPGTPFPPVVIGREGESTLVYLLDGPTAADGFEWYLVTEGEGRGSGHLGWVAAGDAEDAWLVPTTVPCPDEPVELADVTLMAISRLQAIHCLGGREITLRGYYVAPPPNESEDQGECVAEPAWLVCDFGWHGLRTLEAPWAGDANHLPIHLPPDLGPMPPRPGWIEVTGQFDHPAAAQCGDGRPGSDLGCRMEFVVTSARPAE